MANLSLYPFPYLSLYRFLHTRCRTHLYSDFCTHCEVIVPSKFVLSLCRIRGEPDLQSAMATIVRWMDENNYTVQALASLFDQDGDGVLTPEELRDGFVEYITELDEGGHILFGLFFQHFIIVISDVKDDSGLQSVIRTS